MAHRTSDPEVEELWRRFHGAVNMTGHELRTWLMTERSGEDAFRPDPDLGVSELGRSVLRVLNKRQVDLTAEDLATMRTALRVVDSQLARPRPEDDDWRHRLMSVGHDPLRPDSARPGESADLPED
ncbi:DUF3140 domain-containing protein [Allonocardiopsis opalescens]|uniref:Uncharacterized protein DUF3140 n=1 Tax=Allonocardiopsis opalescens TaxID=1144618 RepID=A0A2T0PXB9_9ACTN|nr:DUF3140 domain-containing protein [Allonocardiopsis opalescens]PRX96187.1 uncharacterized protein DUF3140 [Allonocardiopsis opalescens]